GRASGGGGAVDGAGGGGGGGPRHREGKHGAQSLAAGGDQVVGHLRDHGDVRAGTRQDDGVDPLHIDGQEANQARDGRGRRVFERDNDGQGLTPAGEGRATIETLWWGGQAPLGVYTPPEFARRKGHVALRVRWVNVPNERLAL